MLTFPRVVCIGEALVDFIPDTRGTLLRHVDTFRKVVGGAPANVAVGLARCGVAVGLAARVGADEFGHFLAETLANEGVDTSRFIYDSERRTGLTFLQVNAAGERSFLFYRRGAAETALTTEDIDPDYIREAVVLQLGTNTMMQPEGRQATLLAATCAREAGVLVSGDPNLRLHMWPSEEACFDAARRLIEHLDFVKLSDEEATLLTGYQDPVAAADSVCADGARLCVVTTGPNGCTWSSRWGRGALDAPEVEVIDTTGAGDAFVAGMLSVLHTRCSAAGTTDFNAEFLAAAMTKGVALGSRAVTAWGATAGVMVESL